MVKKPPAKRHKVRKSSTAPDRVKSGLAISRVALNAATATQVLFKDAGDTFGNMLGGFRELKNIDAAIVIYIGPDSTVTSATGYPIAAGGAFNLSGAGRLFLGEVWAIGASGTPAVATISY